MNGHSLVGASHRYAVHILRSAGCDVVAVVHRSRESPCVCVRCDLKPSMVTADDGLITNTQPSFTASISHAKTQQSVDNPANLVDPLTTYTDSLTSLLMKFSHRQLADKKYESQEHLTVVDSLSSLCPRPVHRSKEHLAVVDSRTSLNHCAMQSNKEHLTVVDGRSSLSYCSVLSSSRSMLCGSVASAQTSSLSIAQQEDSDNYSDTVSLQSFVTLQDSKPQDQVTCFCCGSFYSE